MPTEDEKPDERDELAGEAAPEESHERRGGVRGRLEAFIPEMVKRTFYTGLGAVFTTEEGIRKMAQEFSLPKDVANYLISSAQGTKDELFKMVGRELKEFLQNMNISDEIAKVLTKLSVEVKTEFRFIPNDQSLTGVKRDTKSSVSIKRVKDDDRGNGGGEGETT